MRVSVLLLLWAGLLFGQCPNILSTLGTGVLPLETHYTGRNGEARFFRDGVLFQKRADGRWDQIGVGRYINNQIYEDIVITVGNAQTQYQQPRQQQQQQYYQPDYPDLTPLSSYRIDQTRYTDDKYFPNTGRYYQTEVRRMKIGNHTIEILAAPGTENAINGTVATISQMPWKRIEALSTVRLNTGDYKDNDYFQRNYKDFKQAAATADGQGNMDVYGRSVNNFLYGDNEAVRITRHELGHLIAGKVFGSTDPSYTYVDKAKQDPYTVSTYGNNSWAEDFAEGIELYLRTQAGQWSPQTRNQVPNRFKYYDGVFNYNVR